MAGLQNMVSVFTLHVTLFLLLVVLSRMSHTVAYTATIMVTKKSTPITDIPGSDFYPKSAPGVETYYKILDIHDHGTDGHMYVGGRNLLTELSERNLTLVREIQVTPSASNIPTGAFNCDTLKGSSEPDYYCQFYVTFVQEVNDTTSILCGTNALYPQCNTFRTGVSNLDDSTSWNAIGLTASVPDQQTSTLAYIEGEDLVVYAGAPTETEGVFAFSRKVFGPDGVSTSKVSTDTTDSDWIESRSSAASPSFIGDPIRYNGKVYFFFREEAVEAKNVEKVVYSRVGQVCEDDAGGVSGTLANQWTTFLKARLSCSTQGNVKLYFDDLQSIYRSKVNSNIIFGVFTTPTFSIPASALCAYDLSEIEQLFAGSPFKNQANSNSLWLNVAAGNVPDPRPGTCGETMPVANYPSLDSIQLMSSLVPNKANYTATRTWRSSMESDYPILISLGQWFRHLVVQENASPGYDIFYFGTDNGQIFKAYIYKSTPRIIDEIKLTMDGGAEESINALRISGDGTTLYASTSSRIYRLPAVNCARFKTCQECIGGLDPACSWVSSGEEQGCRATTSGMRDIENGDTGVCPAASTTTTTQTMPATPAGRTTAEPSSSARGGTTNRTDSQTPKHGESQTGEQSDAQECHLWIVSTVILGCTLNVPACIVLVWWCLRRRRKYNTNRRYSSPIKRERDQSQKVPLNSVENHENHSENDESDESAPMTEPRRSSSQNSSPQKQTIITVEEANHGKTNGRTHSVKTPVKGTTATSSDV